MIHFWFFTFLHLCFAYLAVMQKFGYQVSFFCPLGAGIYNKLDSKQLVTHPAVTEGGDH